MKGESYWFPESSLDAGRLSPIVASILERVDQAMSTDRMPHAVLLAGPPGLGRELLAVEIALRSVLPEDHGSEVFDSVARRVRSGVHPDVVLVQGEGRKNVIKIASIRKIVDDAPGRPFEGSRRVWILDGVDSGRFPAEAANAFLKVLEEPPGHVRFILLAANPQAVLATIRSRCSSLVLPGVVAATAAVAAATGLPPEIAGTLDEEEDLRDFFPMVTRGLKKVLTGDRQAALSLATILAGRSSGYEIAAAAALELAADPQQGELREVCAGLAAELVESQRVVAALALRPERQLIASFLRWGGGGAM